MQIDTSKLNTSGINKLDDIKRIYNEPITIENVGNTCYLSSLI